MNKRKKRIKLLLVDDHPVVRKGIRSCLEGHDHLQILGEAIDGQQAVDKVKELSPDIVLMDIDMPNMSGLEATKIIRKDFPKTRVLILSVHTNKEPVLQIIKSGAQGYVLKDASPEVLVGALEAIDAGEPFFSPDISHLGVGVRTIETHRERVMDKLNIHSVAGLTKYAIANGIVNLE
jgi:two-component system nitrate/nitrite response regulator NarL